MKCLLEFDSWTLISTTDFNGENIDWTTAVSTTVILPMMTCLLRQFAYFRFAYINLLTTSICLRGFAYEAYYAVRSSMSS